MALEFGRELAAADDPLDWLEPIVSAAADAAKGEWNFGLLCGYFRAIGERHPGAVEDFKRRADRSPELAPALPLVCRDCGIGSSDIRRVLDMLEADQLSPDHLLPWEHSMGFVDVPPATVSPLFDWLLSRDDADAFRVGVCLLGSYVCEKSENLDKLQSQVRLLAENAARHEARLDGGLLDHYFEQIMREALRKGWQDPDARAIALALAKGLAGMDMDECSKGELIRTVLPLLLSDFTEIVWPMLGQAIAADPEQRDCFRDILESRPYEATEPPPILSLPEEVLFAWCHEHPDCAPAFAASVVPVLATGRGDPSGRALHPILSRLINEFGERKDMQKEIANNIHLHCFSGSGPSDQRYELFLALLEPLHGRHPKEPVRRWARDTLRSLRKHAEADRRRTAEREAQWEV